VKLFVRAMVIGDSSDGGCDGDGNDNVNGVQVVVVRGAGETSEPVLVDAEDIDNHSIDWRWYIFIMTVSKWFESLSNTGRAFCSGGDVVSLYKGDAELQVICFVVLVWFWSRINFEYNALNIRLQATYL
jgi:hypothetical protein